jgi:hypothetical protein
VVGATQNLYMGPDGALHWAHEKAGVAWHTSLPRQGCDSQRSGRTVTNVLNREEIWLSEADFVYFPLANSLHSFSHNFHSKSLYIAV